jgi:hypothetical protein
LLINRDIRAKLKRNPEELARWEQALMNEMRRAVVPP